jgi:hypothetical protein
MNLEQFVLRFCPTHALLQVQALELRHKLELSEAKLEMAAFCSEQKPRPEAPRKAPIVRTTSWRQFQEKVADLQEKEQ